MSQSAIVGAAMSEASIAAFLIIGALITILLLVWVGVAVQAWWNSRQEARRAERETALKKELLDRGLSVEEIERLLRASSEPPKQLAKADADIVGEFGGILGTCQADPGVIEEIFALVRTADSATRLAMLRAVEEMRDASDGQMGQITDVQVRAVVRALACPAGPSAESVSLPNDLPPLTEAAPRFSDAFRASDRPG